MIGAVVLAAGLSQRMGRPKMILPWGSSTVIGQVVDVLIQSGSMPVVVVTGGWQAEVEQALQGKLVQMVFNPDYANGEMLCSLQEGLRSLPAACEAALLALGDQPQIDPTTVRALLGAYRQKPAPVVMPSYQMRRGHPWLLRRDTWPEIWSLKPPQTLRDFLTKYKDAIQYVVVDTPLILEDMDTPEDYERLRQSLV
ncbi:MAG TPA: nucleotidyltransferase family protein [Anaerolineaceae bacterium]|nr:nucleotidyltransferase family protein [Anaerolineaceae bacterium]HPN50581.1 nucleotidyltransferase family protein [Anaerolineaceae bacterium]